MTKQHPITPPPELVQQWQKEPYVDDHVIATRAAQWGADQELELCCEFLQQEGWGPTWVSHLRAARRPKPPSLKQQSIALLDLIQGNEKSWQLEDLDVVRRALEALPE